MGLSKILLVCGVLAALVAPADSPTLPVLQELLAQGEYGAAEEQGRALLATLEAETSESADIAAVLDVLLEARWRSGKATDPETVAIGERALAMKRRLLGPRDAGVGKTLHHMAILAYFAGDYALAESRWREAIAIRKEALGADHPDVAESMNGLANLYQVVGDFEGARRLYESAVEIRTAAFGPDDPRVGHTLNNLGVLLSTLGDYAAALPVAERSLAIKRKMFGDEHLEVAVGLLNLGDVYDMTGDRVRAREHAAKAVAIWERAYGPEHPEVAAGLNNLAEQMRRAGEYAEAIPLFERALAIWEQVQGPEHPDTAIALNNLAQTLEASGRLDEALALAQRTVAVREKALGRDHPSVAASLNSLARVQARMGRLDAAAGTYRRCVDVRRAAYGDENPEVAESLAGLALVHALGGNPRDAFDEALEAERIARDHLRLTGRALAEQHALRYAATRTRGLDLALTLALEREDAAARREVLDAVVRSRAVVLDEISERQRAAIGSGDPRVTELATNLARARALLANLVVRGPGGDDVEGYREAVDEARDAKERAERELGAASADFARRQQIRRTGLDDVAARLPPRSALVAYLQYDRLVASSGERAVPTGERTPSYAALILRQEERAPSIVPLGTRADVDELVRRWKREVTAGAGLRRDPETALATYRAAGTALRESIWNPVAERVGDADRVFVVPDGSLNLVSLAALPTDAERYLIETGPTIHYLSAARDLAAQPSTPGRGMLVLGGPDYEVAEMRDPSAAPTASLAVGSDGSATRGGSCADLRSLHFDPLPGAATETSEIAALWNGTRTGESAPEATSLTGPAATERAFKDAVRGRRMLHVATHGFFLGGDCSSGAGSRGLKIVEPQAPEPLLRTPVSPLLLSGLAMAGANRRSSAAAGSEDGILTAEEIAALDLSGVEWAVLSACDTGVGEIQAGEGVFGLRRAMQVAGVRTLIMSLWPVDDEATRSWMEALYRGRLGQGLDSARAVREAGASVLAARRERGESTHPFYWAAFVAAGDWR